MVCTSLSIYIVMKKIYHFPEVRGLKPEARLVETEKNRKKVGNSLVETIVSSRHFYFNHCWIDYEAPRVHK